MSQTRFGRLAITRRAGQGVVLLSGGFKHSYFLKLIDLQEGSAKLEISVPDTLAVSVRRNWGSLGIPEFTESLMPHNGKRYTIIQECDAITLDGIIEINAGAIVGKDARLCISAPQDVGIWRDELATQVLREARG